MQQSIGHTIKFTLRPARRWLSLGPGWAAVAGALSAGWPEAELVTLLKVAALWLLVDPILGTLWDLAVQQGLWRRVVQAQLPPPPARGFYLPYARPGSVGGQFVLLARRYRVWWAESFGPNFGGKVTTFGVGLFLALLIGLALKPAIFWLVALAVGLIFWAGLTPPELSATGGGRLASVVQFLLPWLMGALLWANLPLLSVILALCFWVVYLGALRMLGRHHRAQILFFGGQLAAVFLLLALRLLPGAAILSLLLAAQGLVKTNYNRPDPLLQKVQPFLVFGLLVAGISLGSLGG